jgi:hypothetical protein
MRHRLFAWTALVFTATAACSSGAPATSDDAAVALADAAPAPRLDLTAAERQAILRQTEFELEQMGLIASTARDSGVEYTLILRLPFAWNFFTNDMLCALDEAHPEGCRSGTLQFDPSITFPRFAPDVHYEYAWQGAVGSLEGQSGFSLSGLPAYWVDRDDLEPREDALIEVRAHTETVLVSRGEGADVYVFERDGQKDFDVIREGEPLRLAHRDYARLEARRIEGGADVRSLHYTATYRALRVDPVAIEVDVDDGGNATGEVRRGDVQIATISGAPFADPFVALAFTWSHDADPIPTGCTPSCGERLCGPETACGSSCGDCSAESACSPLGSCEPRTEAVQVGD